MSSDHHINILLVDELPLVTEGWREILSKAGDFLIINEVRPNLLINTVSTTSAIEIVLADVSLLTSTSEKSKILQVLKTIKSYIKVVLTVGNEKELRKARRAGADEAIYKPFRSEALINLIRGLSRDDKGLCDQYARNLEEVGFDSGDTEKHGKLIVDILQLILSSTSRTFLEKYGGERDRSIIFQNRKNDTFWQKIYDKHRTEQILFSVQNTKKVDRSSFQRLARKLSETNGNLGILVVRSVDTRSSELLQLATFRNNQKVILLVTDKDIRKMLAQKAAGMEDAQLFEEIYENFFALLTQLIEDGFVVQKD